MLLEWWSCTECTLFTDQATVERFGKEHAVIILNHNFEIDFLCGWTMCERYGVLGSSKVLAKKELLYVPLIGWTWYFLEIVFCKRKWEEDRDTVIEGLRRLSDYPEYMWVSARSGRRPTCQEEATPTPGAPLLTSQAGEPHESLRAWALSPIGPGLPHPSCGHGGFS
ncbi:1-acyl-sn-glycerol-3-phosphate acyltransferase gamma [Saguinus oedipus]|uniref:1-acyl-sn-glycerol-3-phosphate acyltransferase gamma n=1 Tax=Saguinus oedipus TaxID=9490 RepID=A0ABQ9TYB8_SAGOE|nr:1-acyl-sn-glycerol-3-phosphate acyltransferase gamma [Saguinus oedipus]